MKLLIIYGPPAVGKLTVAQELAKITGFKIFHNHMSNDIIREYIKSGTDKFWDYSNKLRAEIFKMAVKEDIDLIFTVCYTSDLEGDQGFIKRTVNLIRRRGGKVLFVQLKTGIDSLMKRVKGESRKNYGKLKDADELRNIMNKYDMTSPVIYKPNLVIDNTNKSPNQVAQVIKEHYKLK